MNDLYLRAVVVLVLVSVGFGTGWKVATWRADAATAEAARQYAADLADAEDRVHKAEQDALSRQAAIEAGYQANLGKVRHEKDVAISQLTAGRKLYVDTISTCNSTVPQGSQPDGGSTTTTRTELPLAIGANLESFGSECDALAVTYKTAYDRLKAVEGH